MKRAVVCVATTERYLRGMTRLANALTDQHVNFHYGTGNWPTHEDKPYAFKAYALKQAAESGSDLVLWCDASILPVRSLEPLWERIERDGYWIARNGWTNYEWTADSAYQDLFSYLGSERWTGKHHDPYNWTLEAMREINRRIPHVVATSFGLNLKSDIGKAFLAEYYRLASETRAFCGPWTNSNQVDPNGVSIQQALGDLPRMGPCGPPDVRGHRHDQTAASVIAWRLGMKLTDCPEVFAYPPGDERTILLADGSYL